MRKMKLAPFNRYNKKKINVLLAYLQVWTGVVA